ncbi:hypothetical protein ACET3Z_025894 [Daucus carota]
MKKLNVLKKIINELKLIKDQKSQNLKGRRKMLLMVIYQKKKKTGIIFPMMRYTNKEIKVLNTSINQRMK